MTHLANKTASGSVLFPERLPWTQISLSPSQPQPSASTAGLPRRRPHDDLRVVVAAAADTCPQPGSEIATDRPDTTNSGLAVPQGSFQQEKGVNTSGREGG